MRCLLDTHVFIWALTDTRRLSAPVKELIEDISNELYISAVSFWEISIKLRNKRLASIGHEPCTLVEAAKAMGFIPISMTPLEAASQGELAENTHFDPFDRMLIWQAINRDFTLISQDRDFKKFAKDGLKLFWK